jgi:pyridoxine kinase
MKTCAELAVDFISASIRDAVEEGTDRNDGVCFEQHLGMLLP